MKHPVSAVVLHQVIQVVFQVAYCKYTACNHMLQSAADKLIVVFAVVFAAAGQAAVTTRRRRPYQD